MYNFDHKFASTVSNTGLKGMVTSILEVRMRHDVHVIMLLTGVVI